MTYKNNNVFIPKFKWQILSRDNIIEIKQKNNNKIKTKINYN